ncbi:helix-turn-helix domain-containing protein [Collimonas silvisoli]|uniref:helix-turn-helix domain-containing protein n=1 Tax=Collimonas silvisoli TaxID=2825884 RepID=UPI001B8C304C|nr:helix-turn-helix domain-containing protein [Collimonas silvisoli]
MRSIGEILKEERQRLGMNQDDFAAVGGLKRRAQTLYEQDERAPDALYLRALAAIGVDVQYILTGEKSSSALAQDEKELLSGYRNLDIRGKAGVLGLIDGMSAAPAATTSKQSAPHVEFHGKVGQSVTGNIDAPQTFHMGGGKKKPKP